VFNVAYCIAKHKSYHAKDSALILTDKLVLSHMRCAECSAQVITETLICC
jgi:hypothetical protein